MVKYIDILRENGFQSDQEFMEAWAKEPDKWIDLFAMRMVILTILSE